MIENSDLKVLENYDYLFVMTVGDFKSTKIKNIFSKYFKNTLNVQTIEEAVNVLNNNNIDIILSDDNSTIDPFIYFKESRQHNENILTFLATDNLNTHRLLKSIEFKLDGYLLENSPQSKLLSQINKALFQYTSNKHNSFVQSYFDVTNKCIIISKTNPSGILTYVNKKFCETSGFTYDELIGQNHNIIRHPDNDKKAFESLWETIKIKKLMWEGIMKNKSKGGVGYLVKAVIIPILDKNNNVLEYISFNINISNSMNDKKLLLHHIEENELSILALIKIDDFHNLDQFYSDKKITKMERLFGESLLIHLPNKNIFRNIYHLGNGKFALLCKLFEYKETDINIKKYLENFVRKVNNTKLATSDIQDDLNIFISFSYGKHMLYQDAKQGLKEAIKKKKLVHHSNDAYLRSQKTAKKNKEIIQMVKIALDNNNIISYFQPIINNKTKQIEKYESLVRLVNQNNEVLSPHEFLDISKKGKYYNKITQRVVENSFKVLDKIDTEVTINLSMIDIEKNDTRNMLLKLLDKYQEHAKKIVFELLEDERSKNFTVIQSFIRNVKNRGIKIAIDDFGSGYSSFERLLCFEPDIIKIDGSLIKNIEYDTFSRNLVETIALFSKKQNIKTVAEYVENENIFNIVNQIGVDYSQGYFFGKPQNLNLN